MVAPALYGHYRDQVIDEEPFEPMEAEMDLSTDS